MDLKIVEDLLALMQEGELTELHVVQGETEIRLARQPDGALQPVAYAAAAPAAAAPAAPAPATPQPATQAAPPAAEEPAGEVFRSPMVGTFYARPEPDADAYVNVGEVVGDDTVLCILEAMKVFNEIKAESSGTVLEVLVQDGDAVEYDQPLFRYKAS